jgi:hypothetical protein
MRSKDQYLLPPQPNYVFLITKKAYHRCRHSQSRSTPTHSLSLNQCTHHHTTHTHARARVPRTRHAHTNLNTKHKQKTENTKLTANSEHAFAVEDGSKREVIQITSHFPSTRSRIITKCVAARDNTLPAKTTPLSRGWGCVDVHYTWSDLRRPFTCLWTLNLLFP